MDLHEVPERDEREDRLPRWAREQLERCRRIARVSQESAREAHLKTDPDESVATLNSYDDLPIGLGADPRVTFRLGGGRSITAYVAGDSVILRGSAGLSIIPRVTNVVSVKVVG